MSHEKPLHFFDFECEKQDLQFLLNEKLCKRKRNKGQAEKETILPQINENANEKKKPKGEKTKIPLWQPQFFMNRPRILWQPQTPLN